MDPVITRLVRARPRVDNKSQRIQSPKLLPMFGGNFFMAFKLVLDFYAQTGKFMFNNSLTFLTSIICTSGSAAGILGILLCKVVILILLSTNGSDGSGGSSH